MSERGGRAAPAPLRITAELASPLVSSTPWVHLDEALVVVAVLPSGPRRKGPPADVQLPLGRTGSPDERVWCCSALWLPDGARSRALGPLGARLWAPAQLQAWALGDPGRLREMLRHVDALGDARRDGYGRVRRWRVEPDLAARVRWRAWDGRVRRPLPHPRGVYQGVRPPYGYAPWWVRALGPGAPAAQLGKAPAPEEP